MARTSLSTTPSMDSWKDIYISLQCCSIAHLASSSLQTFQVVVRRLVLPRTFNAFMEMHNVGIIAGK